MKKKKYCTFPDCGRVFSAKGLCATHYDQMKNTGLKAYVIASQELYPQ